MNRTHIITAAAVLTLAVALPAAATGDHTPSVTFGHSTECGAALVSVTATDIPAWWYGVEVLVDDVLAGEAIVQGSGSDTLALTFDEDASDGEAVVTYYVHAATEWDLVPADLNYQATYPEVTASRTFTVDTDCLPPVVVDPPVVTPPVVTPPAAPPAAPRAATPTFTG